MDEAWSNTNELYELRLESMGEVGLWSSGAVWDAGILLPGGGIASCWAGKDEERGEGVMGEKGPDTERVRW